METIYAFRKKVILTVHVPVRLNYRLLRYVMYIQVAYYFIQIPVPVPDNIFFTCTGHTKHHGNIHRQGARITPGIPKCKYLESTIAKGILTIPIDVAAMI
jgi:hypothetical protein